MKIDTIYVDMDGVLADFFGAMLNKYNFNADNYPAGEWDMTAPLGITPEQFCNTMYEDGFWLNLPLTPNAEVLWKTTEVTASTLGSKVKILSLYPKNHPNPDRAVTEKIEWCTNHGFFADDYIVKSETGGKAEFASPTSVLIDDNDRNVDEFIRAGGACFQVPRIWNRLHHAVDAMSYEHILWRNYLIHTYKYGVQPQPSMV